MSKQFGVLLIHNPRSDTQVDLRGMEGEVAKERYPSAADALLDFKKESQLRGSLGYVLVYHDDNGQLSMINSVSDLLKEGLITEDEVASVMAQSGETRERIRISVACSNSDGAPDMLQCIVLCDLEEIENGKHYDAAMDVAEREGYDPVLAIDENDPGFEFISWKGGAQTYDINGTLQA
jgi:hypothetical protein